MWLEPKHFLDRAKRDGIAYVEKNDAEMAAAMRKARESLPEFLELAQAPRPTMRGFAVKVAVSETDHTEFFWITPFEQRNNQFTGQINNTPRLVKKVKLGQTIEFRDDRDRRLALSGWRCNARQFYRLCPT